MHPEAPELGDFKNCVGHIGAVTIKRNPAVATRFVKELRDWTPFCWCRIVPCGAHRVQSGGLEDNHQLIECCKVLEEVRSVGTAHVPDCDALWLKSLRLKARWLGIAIVSFVVVSLVAVFTAILAVLVVLGKYVFVVDVLSLSSVECDVLDAIEAVQPLQRRRGPSEAPVLVEEQHILGAPPEPGFALQSKDELSMAIVQQALSRLRTDLREDGLRDFGVETKHKSAVVGTTRIDAGTGASRLEDSAFG